MLVPVRTDRNALPILLLASGVFPSDVLLFVTSPTVRAGGSFRLRIARFRGRHPGLNAGRLLVRQPRLLLVLVAEAYVEDGSPLFTRCPGFWRLGSVVPAHFLGPLLLALEVDGNLPPYAQLGRLGLLLVLVEPLLVHFFWLAGFELEVLLVLAGDVIRGRKV